MDLGYVQSAISAQLNLLLLLKHQQVHLLEIQDQFSRQLAHQEHSKLMVVVQVVLTVQVAMNAKKEALLFQKFVVLDFIDQLLSLISAVCVQKVPLHSKEVQRIT